MMPRLYVPDLQAAYSCRQTVPAFIDGRVYRNVEYANFARDAASTPATHRLEHSNVLCSCAPAGGPRRPPKLPHLWPPQTPPPTDG
jgi:hypothetical protein